MKGVVADKSFLFAIEVVKAARGLRRAKEFELSSQLLRSGTSVGANVAEAGYAQSKADFIAKLSIALKEAAETKYWIRLLQATGDVAPEEAATLTEQATELIRLLTASIKTTKQQQDP